MRAVALTGGGGVPDSETERQLDWHAVLYA